MTKTLISVNSQGLIDFMKMLFLTFLLVIEEIFKLLSPFEI